MKTIAFDIGGAHLKAAVVDGGVVSVAQEIPCPLWLGIDQLAQAFESLGADIAAAGRRAVTMTGELTEIFASRQDGVAQIIAVAERHLGPEVEVFAGMAGLKPAQQALSDPMAVASANFLATARLVARIAPGSLLIDFGSTTTDIVFADRPMGLTDAERLQTGELVYTGFSRTPVPSVTRRAVLAGQWQGLAADAFATMADVRRVIAGADEDRGENTEAIEASLRGLARGFGRDAEVAHLPVWQAAARFIREAQLQQITEGALQVISRPGITVSRAVTAGIGAADATIVAQRLGLDAVAFGDLIACQSPSVSRAATAYAPAAALALLADGEQHQV